MFDPRSRRGKFRCPKTLFLVTFAGMTLDKCIVLRIGALTGCPLCHGQVKEPYGNLDMVTCRLGVYTEVHLPIILERGSGSRNKESLTINTDRDSLYGP